MLENDQLTKLFVEHLDQVKNPVVIDRSDNDAISDKKSIQVTRISSVEVDQVCPDISSFVFTPRKLSAAIPPTSVQTETIVSEFGSYRAALTTKNNTNIRNKEDIQTNIRQNQTEENRNKGVKIEAIKIKNKEEKNKEAAKVNNENKKKENKCERQSKLNQKLVIKTPLKSHKKGGGKMPKTFSTEKNQRKVNSIVKMFENATGGKGEEKIEKIPKNNVFRLSLKFNKDNLEDRKPAKKKKTVEENTIKKYFKPSDTTRPGLSCNPCKANEISPSVHLSCTPTNQIADIKSRDKPTCHAQKTTR